MSHNQIFLQPPASYTSKLLGDTPPTKKKTRLHPPTRHTSNHHTHLHTSTHYRYVVLIIESPANTMIHSGCHSEMKQAVSHKQGPCHMVALEEGISLAHLSGHMHSQSHDIAANSSTARD